MIPVSNKYKYYSINANRVLYKCTMIKLYPCSSLFNMIKDFMYP